MVRPSTRFRRPGRARPARWSPVVSIRCTRGVELKPSSGLDELLSSVPNVIARDGLPLSAAGLLLRVRASRPAERRRPAATIARSHALRGGPEEAWRVLVRSTSGRALFEDTWAELDEECDVDFLVFVVTLMAQAGHEPYATACRVLLRDLPLCRRGSVRRDGHCWSAEYVLISLRAAGSGHWRPVHGRA